MYIRGKKQRKLKPKLSKLHPSIIMDFCLELMLDWVLLYVWDFFLTGLDHFNCFELDSELNSK